MARPGTWEKGQSGNPNGRPPKGRALTEILECAGSATLEDADGKKRSGKRIAARLVWEGVSTGAVTFPGGKVLKLSPTDWFDLLKWVYAQVDGPPKQLMDVTTNDESLNDVRSYTDEQRVRGLMSLFDAVRAGVVANGLGGPGAVDADEHSAVVGVSESGG